MTITYLTNYSNATLTCIAQDNVTTICQGQIAVIPYNQDYSIALLMIITVCIVIITLYCLGKIILRW